MNADCLLQIFLEKGYITIEKHHRGNTKIDLPPYFIVRIKVTKEVIPKMIEIVSNDDNYLYDYSDGYNYFYYTAKKDLLDFIKTLKEMNQERIYFGGASFGYLEKYEQEWIDNNTQFWCEHARVIINKEIRGERIKREKQNDIDAMELINRLTSSVPKELIFSDIKMKYDYDYTYTSEEGHQVESHKKIVPSFTNMVEIFSDLIEYDLPEYCSFDGPNRKYIEDCTKEIQRMEKIKHEIEEEYGDAVKCILGEWNESIQYGCALYVYIL